MKVLSRFLLGADLDGTLIPNKASAADQGCLARTVELLNVLHEAKVPVAYFSHRNLSSARQIARTYRLPKPSWWSCSAGTELYDANGLRDQGWFEQLGDKLDTAALRQILYDIRGLTLQYGAHQATHTLSFHSRDQITDELKQAILMRAHRVDPNLHLTYSLEPRTNRGIVHLISGNGGKAAVMAYLADKSCLTLKQTCYAGDEGDDIQVLISGVRGIMVGNARRECRDLITRVRRDHPDACAYVARQNYGDGIIEGLHLYKFVD